MNILQICPPHPSDVATLPCEIQKVTEHSVGISAKTVLAILSQCFIVL